MGDFAGDRLSDRLPADSSDDSASNFSASDPADRHSPTTAPVPTPSQSAHQAEHLAALQQTEAALLEKLAPAQLRSIASWMRAIADTYAHPTATQVSHSFRAQASRLDQLARQAASGPESDSETIVATLMSPTVAYLMTAAGQYLRQPLGQPGEADCPAEPCSPAEFRQAYNSAEFTVLLGAERLAERFGPEAWA